MGLIIGLGFTALLLTIGWLVGSANERRHFRELAEREAVRKVLLTNLKRVPSTETIHGVAMVQGQCVVASDYFKTFVASWKRLIGGELRSFQTMMTRARREAIQRMCEHAERMGATEVHNVRFETSNIKSMQGNDRGAPQVEVLVYGTAVVRTSDSQPV